jgi:hypothetical protein
LRPVTLLRQVPCDGQASVAADGDERVETLSPELIHDIAGAVHGLHATIGLLYRHGEGVAPVRRSQDGAADVGDAPHRVTGQRDDAAFHEQPLVGPLDSIDLPAKVQRAERRGSDHGVESLGITAAGVDRDLHDAHPLVESLARPCPIIGRAAAIFKAGRRPLDAGLDSGLQLAPFYSPSSIRESSSTTGSGTGRPGPSTRR